MSALLKRDALSYARTNLTRNWKLIVELYATPDFLIRALGRELIIVSLSSTMLPFSADEVHEQETRATMTEDFWPKTAPLFGLERADERISNRCPKMRQTL